MPIKRSFLPQAETSQEAHLDDAQNDTWGVRCHPEWSEAESKDLCLTCHREGTETLPYKENTLGGPFLLYHYFVSELFGLAFDFVKRVAKSRFIYIIVIFVKNRIYMFFVS